MALLVDDIAKAREGLLAEASARGLAVVPFRPRDLEGLELEVPDLGSFVRTAEALQARAVYVSGAWFPADEEPAAPRAALSAVLASLPDQEDERAKEGRAIVERALTLLRDHGYPSFIAGFTAGGVLHSVHVADRVAWPFVRDFTEAEESSEGPEVGEGDEDGEEDGEHLCLERMTPTQGAGAMLDFLESMGVTRAEMRRKPSEHAAMAVIAMEGDVTELKGERRKHLQAVEREAVRRMRKG